MRVQPCAAACNQRYVNYIRILPIYNLLVCSDVEIHWGRRFAKVLQSFSVVGVLSHNAKVKQELLYSWILILFIWGLLNARLVHMYSSYG